MNVPHEAAPETDMSLENSVGEACGPTQAPAELPQARRALSNHPLVLVLDADSRAGLACVQSLGNAGAIVHASMRDKHALTAQSRWCRHIEQQPEFEPIDVALDWLLNLDACHDFVLIIPATEGSLRWLRHLPEAHPLRLKAQLPADDALDVALDKARTTALGKRLGLPVPASLQIQQNDAPPAAFGFPSVLKPVRSKVVVGGVLKSFSVEVVQTPEQRQGVLASWLPYTEVQEQRWVQGRGIGIEMLFDHGRMVWAFMHERLHEYPLTGGASTLRRSVEADPRLLQWSHRLLLAPQWHGVAMVEWRCSAGGDGYLMEINPRLWGSLPLTIASGLNVPQHLLSMAQGQRFVGHFGYVVGMTARNPVGDLRWFFENWRADRSNSMLLTHPPVAVAAGWLRVFTGREVWDGWHWRDWRVGLRDGWHLVSYVPRKLASRLRDRIMEIKLRRHHAVVQRTLRHRQAPIRSVYFVCYGNICRSPFAERAASVRWPGIDVRSGGFHAKTGRSSPAHLVDAAKSMGVDLQHWTSRRISAEDVDQADLIVLMDVNNWKLFASHFPKAQAKTTLLGLFEPRCSMEIADPYSLDPERTRLILAEVLQALDALSAQYLAIR